jgi:uncharacterized protein YkwD
MRFVQWFGGLVLVVVVGATVGVVSLHHRQAATPPALTASHSAAIADSSNSANPNRLLPRHLKPAPSPTPSSAPPASSDAGGSRGAAPVAAAPAIVVRSTQQALINGDRARNGLGSLTWSSCLYNVAVANANRIAAQGYLSHTNGPQVDLTCGLGHQAGENVGWYSGGANDSWMNSKFMASPEHYANIMGPYRYVATAWVVTSDGRGYVAVEFG